jgi:Lipase (class 3)
MEDHVPDSSLLKKSSFDLEIAVFLAKASEIAYSTGDGIKLWAQSQGFANTTPFDSEDVQGFWSSSEDVSLLVFRGTSNPGQWLRDVRFFPAVDAWGHVHIGFLSGIAAVESAMEEFAALAARSTHVWIAGHSLGGALSLVAAAKLKMKSIRPLVCTFGQPRVGLGDFAERYSIELPERLWRFVNQSDIVTRVPPDPIYRHTGTVKRIVRPGVLESMVAQGTAVNLETLVLQGTVDQSIILKDVVAGGSALESANRVSQAAVSQPTIVDTDVPSLTQLEFGQLQLALGAANKPELEGPTLEGALPWFSDHAISEYIRLLTEIGDSAISGRPAESL